MVVWGGFMEELDGVDLALGLSKRRHQQKVVVL